MNKRLFITILLCAAAAGVSAQPALSLDEALSQGLESNYGIKIARGQARIATNNHTSYPFLPSLGATLRQNQEINDSRSDSGEGTVKRDYTYNTYNADATLKWRLFDGMAMFADYATTRQLMQEGELQLRDRIESLVADVSSRYYDIVTQAHRLNASKLYLEISTLRYNQALEKYLLQTISGLEMKQAKIDFNADSSRLVQQQEVLRNAYIALYEAINLPLDSRFELSDSVAPGPRLELATLKASAARNNTSILLAASGVKVSELAIRTAQAMRYPSLDFTSTYRFNRSDERQTTKFSQVAGPTWGFTLSGTLFNGGDVNRRIRNARIEADNSTLTADQVRLAVESAIDREWNTYQKNFLMIDFEAESADVALANVQAAMEMNRLGTISGVEFREIQRSYLEAVERKLSALYQAKLSEINLLYLAGMMVGQ